MYVLKCQQNSEGNEDCQKTSSKKITNFSRNKKRPAVVKTVFLNWFVNWFMKLVFKTGLGG